MQISRVPRVGELILHGSCVHKVAMPICTQITDGYCLLVNLVLSERAVYKQLNCGRPLCRVVRNRLLRTRLTHFWNNFATMLSTFGLHTVLALHLHGCKHPARPRINPARLRAAAAATETSVKLGRGRPKKVDSAGTAATAAQQKTEEDVEKYALPLDNAENEIIREEQPHEMKLDSHESLDELQDKVKPCLTLFTSEKNSSTDLRELRNTHLCMFRLSRVRPQWLVRQEGTNKAHQQLRLHLLSSHGNA